MNRFGNTVTAFTKEQDQIDINERKRHIMPHLSRFERIGALAMTSVGRLGDLLNANDGTEDHLSPLRRNAYKNSRHAHIARRVWGGIAVATLTSGLMAGAATAEVLDDYLACDGEQRVELLEGGKLTDLAKQIPHEDTPLSRVIDAIADNSDNRGLVGVDYVTDSPNPDDVLPGTYVTPLECNSVL